MFPVIITLKPNYVPADVIAVLNKHGCHEPKVLPDGRIEAHISEICLIMVKGLVAEIKRV